MALLFLAVVITFANAIRPFAINKVSVLLTRRKKTKLQQKKEAIKGELDEINMKEDFARYAKKEREYNAVAQACQDEARAKKMTNIKVHLVLNYVSHAALTLICLALFWMNRAQPVVELPENWLRPFSLILSWPTQIPGAISYPVWFIMCSSSWKLVAKTLKLPS